MKYGHRRNLWRRAKATDDSYGPTCPVCANRKDRQSVLCKRCRTDEQRGILLSVPTGFRP